MSSLSLPSLCADCTQSGFSLARCLIHSRSVDNGGFLTTDTCHCNPRYAGLKHTQRVAASLGGIICKFTSPFCRQSRFPGQEPLKRTLFPLCSRSAVKAEEGAELYVSVFPPFADNQGSVPRAPGPEPLKRTLFPLCSRSAVKTEERRREMPGRQAISSKSPHSRCPWFATALSLVGLSLFSHFVLSQASLIKEPLKPVSPKPRSPEQRLQSFEPVSTAGRKAQEGWVVPCRATAVAGRYHGARSGSR